WPLHRVTKVPAARARCAGRAARREDALPYGSAGTVPAWRRAIGSAGERLVHTEEVTGSIPVSPTDVRPDQRLHGQLSSYALDGSCRHIGRILGVCPSPRWVTWSSQSAERHDSGVPLEMSEWSRTATRRVCFMF